MQRRALFSFLVIASLAAGCIGDDAAADPIVLYSVDVSQLSRELSRVDRAYDMVIDRLRPDSGTLRADTLFLEMDRAISDTVRAVVGAVDNTALQFLLWRDGAVGQSITRKGNFGSMLTGGRGGDPEVELRELFKRNGVYVLREEGDSYFIVDQLRLAAAVYPYVTDATRDYMRLVAIEQQHPFTGHAVILIPWDSLAGRIQQLDDMILRHAFTPVSPALEAWRARYLAGYLTGFENTSVFDTGGVLRDDVRASFERFSAANPRSFSGTVVANHLDTLRDAGFRKPQRTPQ